MGVGSNPANVVVSLNLGKRALARRNSLLSMVTQAIARKTPECL